MAKKIKEQTTEQLPEESDKLFLDRDELSDLEGSINAAKFLVQEIQLLDSQLQIKKLEIQVKQLEGQLLSNKQQSIKEQLANIKSNRSKKVIEIKEKYNIKSNSFGYDDLTGEIKEDTSNG